AAGGGGALEPRPPPLGRREASAGQAGPQAHRSRHPTPVRGYARPMPTPVADILAEADRLLEPARYKDYCVNGLQVPGPENATRIATGVSANADLFERAGNAQADLL